uniref:NAD(P)H-quinone oxidoreductase subunit 6, chloroplastic n=2 Tax=Psilotum nudum TaxID=3240 RepID=NU6C_PSINU|nr:NADH dehydrogenase subunit 6 [Psilotum nudum]Q8WHX6.1 RecName: Full=NAD(P)H-quinone oxidoreductase subunit 6, chloroplastic; AltName: Full=NAD(P)H dehydrogenase subunit 6; AltName: Full=NADH-plastoquinone oxidoreductase subunit 6 [Psilotum nudum]AGC26846.1 NAD(P)H-quinone oxidoreductase subunit 6 [Psilotum nudum]BAB84277.1 NADH dehydrogenase ND6 subunit [Psilotum nudum]
MNLPESIQKGILLIIELGILLGSMGVILLNDIVQSAFSLGLTFISISLLYLVLNADFVAAAQVLIYVGAINVLIVFSVMLIQKPHKNEDLSTSRNTGNNITLIVCTSLFLFLVSIILDTSWSQIYSIKKSTKIFEPILKSNVQLIGSQLLTEFLLPFELLSVLLLVALVGAITMSRQSRMFEMPDDEI